MAGGLVEGSALGAVFQEMLKPISWLISKAWKFKSTRKNLGSTVDRLIPVVEEMKRLDLQLDRPKEETDMPMEELREGKRLVSKYSKVPWWKCCFLPCYQDKLQEMEETQGRSLLVMQAGTARDVRETLLTVKGISHGKQVNFKGLCGAPEKPDITVGLDRHLNNLRIQMLQSGVSVFVVTGLAGSGKTTLATMLCWDEKVRGKFKDNILFVTVSKTPSLKIIVQTLFQHCGRVVPDFLTDEQAVHQLKIVLRQIGESPMMLVLDDVWPGSESIIEAFKVQLSDYKVVVTSRVEFPRFGTSCYLKPVCHEDAVTLFRRHALINDERSYIPDEDLVEKVAKGCWGSPLALEVIGRSLCGQPIEVWQRMEREVSKGRSILDSNTDFLDRIQKCLDVLEDKPIIKECFMDLGLFPEDQKIPVAALIDMWRELYEQVDDDIDAVSNVHDLANRHLASLVVTREKVVSDVDNYYNHHFLVQHDLLREIAIHQASKEPYEQRKRLIFDINENNSPQQNLQQAVARTLSISTDKMFTSDWCNTIPAGVVEVLVLNLRTKKYILPEFEGNLSRLKVLIVTNYDGFHFSELSNFELLGSLSTLKRIRLERVSVPSFGTLNNLRKLSLYMCNTGQAFETQIPDALPNLEELSIDYCKDLVTLPTGLCDITSLRILSITKCSKFSTLAQEIGNLKNLEILRLSSCVVLGEIPASIGRLNVLSFLDISYCISLVNLPDEIGDLLSLRKLHMTGCSNCKLPLSVTKLEHLRRLICDEETAASWQLFKSDLPNLNIEEAKFDVNLNWLGGVHL